MFTGRKNADISRFCFFQFRASLDINKTWQCLALVDNQGNSPLPLVWLVTWWWLGIRPNRIWRLTSSTLYWLIIVSILPGPRIAQVDDVTICFVFVGVIFWENLTDFSMQTIGHVDVVGIVQKEKMTSTQRDRRLLSKTEHSCSLALRLPFWSPVPSNKKRTKVLVTEYILVVFSLSSTKKSLTKW